MRLFNDLIHSSQLLVLNYRTIHSLSGNWVGIEWDDAERGKHGGDHEGIRYFSCRYIYDVHLLQTSTCDLCSICVGLVVGHLYGQRN